MRNLMNGLISPRRESRSRGIFLHSVEAGTAACAGSQVETFSGQVGLAHRRPSVPPTIASPRPPEGWRKVVPLLALTCAFLFGCGSSETPGSTGDTGAIPDSLGAASAIPPPPGPTDGAAGPAVGPDSSWITTVSYVGHGLRLSVRGVETLTIGCVRESREMTVDVPGFSSIGSEERLSLGIDNEPYVFVAQVTPPPPAGVHATRSIDEEVLAALRNASTLSAFYGAQTSGPHAAPDSTALRDFLAGCRRAAAG